MSKALFVISSSGFSNFSCPRKAKVWRYSYLQTAAFMSSGISSVLLLIVLSDCLQSSSDTHHTIQPSSCCLWFRSRASRQSFSKGIFPFQIPLSLLFGTMLALVDSSQEMTHSDRRLLNSAVQLKP